MANNDVILNDQASTPLVFKPKSVDRGSGIREFVHGTANSSGSQINPATEDTLALIQTAIALLSKDSTSAKDASLQTLITSLSNKSSEATSQSILTALGLIAKETTQQTQTTTLGTLAKDSTVAKDASLQSILTALNLVSKDSTSAKDTTLQNVITTLTNGISISNFPASQVVKTEKPATRFNGLTAGGLSLVPNTYTNTSTGFVVGDLLNLVGGTLISGASAGQIRVSSVDGNGKVTGVTLAPNSYGLYSSPPIGTGIASTVATGSGVNPPTFTLALSNYSPMAVTVFSANPPVNGWKVNSPSSTNLGVTDDGTAAIIGGVGTFTVFANGGQYSTEIGEKPAGSSLKIIGDAIGSPFIASGW